jgi:phosphoribosylglycinamide formyltransferase 1
MLQIGVLGSTNGSDLPSIVESTNNGELKGLAEISVVISNKKDSGILQKAEDDGIKNYYLNTKGLERISYDRKISELFEDSEVNLIVCIGYMRWLCDGFVKKYRNKIMNIHPSLLPSFFSGMDLEVHKQVLEYKCKFSGCTLHFVDEGKDTGPSIMRKKVPVFDNDNVYTLKARVQKAEQEIYPKGIKLFAEEKLKVEGRKVIILP